MLCTGVRRCDLVYVVLVTAKSGLVFVFVTKENPADGTISIASFLNPLHPCGRIDIKPLICFFSCSYSSCPGSSDEEADRDGRVLSALPFSLASTANGPLASSWNTRQLSSASTTASPRKEIAPSFASPDKKVKREAHPLVDLFARSVFRQLGPSFISVAGML